MLIICNGAFKCGSSWLHSILVEIANIKDLNVLQIPIKYTNDVNSPTAIIESRLENFLLNEDYKHTNYITKSHFFKKSTLNQDFSKYVKFIFIDRDIRDAVVSHYFHVQNQYNRKIRFSIYYYFMGRFKAYEIYLFNKRCKKFIGKNNFISFEDLVLDFENTIIKISELLEIDNITKEQIAVIKERTSLKKLRGELKIGNVNYYPTNREDNWKLFRKGKLGEWKQYFDKCHIKDIKRIENGKISRTFKICYFFLFTFRRIIFQIE